MLKLNQRDVNKVHALHKQGLDNHAIAQAMGVSKSTPAYVLKHRPPTHMCCDRCGVDVGENRARTIRTSGGNRKRTTPPVWRFCPDCHCWAFRPSNFSEASKLFPGVF